MKDIVTLDITSSINLYILNILVILIMYAIVVLTVFIYTHKRFKSEPLRKELRNTFLKSFTLTTIGFIILVTLYSIKF